jgi:hypothetical protein
MVWATARPWSSDRLGARRVAQHHHTATARQAAHRLAREGSSERINDDVDAARSEPDKPVGEALTLEVDQIDLTQSAIGSGSGLLGWGMSTKRSAS